MKEGVYVKKTFNLDLFKFEFKKVLKDFLFWAMVVMLMWSFVESSPFLFQLPVSSNEQAFHFLTYGLGRGNDNIYGVKLSSVFDKYDNILMAKKSKIFGVFEVMMNWLR